MPCDSAPLMPRAPQAPQSETARRPGRPRPARARRSARALDEVRGWSRWTVGGADRHAPRVARKIFAPLRMALSGRGWPTLFTGTETLSERTVEAHARDGAAAVALVVALRPGAR